MIIIETCPKCGHDLHDVIIATYPPIPKKECFNCGWYWEGEPEQVIRQPFGGNSFYSDNKSVLVGSTYDEFVNIGDKNCSLNNVNRYVYEIGKSALNDIFGMDHVDIAEAVERTKKYEKRV